MKLVRNLTLTELYERLRRSGMSIGLPNLKIAMDNGFLAGIAFRCTIPGAREDEEQEDRATGNPNYKGWKDRYIIIEKDLDDWIDAHSKEIEPDDDMMAFAAQLDQEEKGGVTPWQS